LEERRKCKKEIESQPRPYLDEEEMGEEGDVASQLVRMLKNKKGLMMVEISSINRSLKAE
jgi:hypothetical protein